jgi:SAM-dependent methyltransferase
MADLSRERLDFWEARSSLGFAAGSGDVNLKQLEINAILKSLGHPSFVLDAGCGNGFTLASLAFSVPDCRFFGFDYSQGMINAAIELINEKRLSNRVNVCRASLLDTFPASLSTLGIPDGGFDCIYTERSIINLDTLDQQAQAVQALWGMVAEGGRLVLCEAFLDGLTEINTYREAVSLDPITPPWHNRYLSLSELGDLLPGGNQSYQVVEFSGTYYFVSRVVHAREAWLQGCEPSYDTPINKQSLDLPALPLFGQSKIVIFEKQ